ncbi:MAG: sialate O-acetylesterase, partial [Blautia sp.]|nr:sialate O-acetylesterase [Blautia sp.]
MKLNRIFQNHMVLQQGKPVKIWGTGTENEEITLTFLEHEYHTIVKNGRWMITMDPMDKNWSATLCVIGRCLKQS